MCNIISWEMSHLGRDIIRIVYKVQHQKKSRERLMVRGMK